MYCLLTVPPRITYTSSDGRVEVKKGTSVALECHAEGNPTPRITWSRKNNLLPGGEQTAITSVLALDKVDRHHAGIYQCTASNGIGLNASKQIILHVLCKYFCFSCGFFSKFKLVLNGDPLT